MNSDVIVKFVYGACVFCRSLSLLQKRFAGARDDRSVERSLVYDKDQAANRNQKRDRNNTTPAWLRRLAGELVQNSVDE